jgi:hypothetical protein
MKRRAKQGLESNFGRGNNDGKMDKYGWGSAIPLLEDTLKEWGFL